MNDEISVTVEQKVMELSEADVVAPGERMHQNSKITTETALLAYVKSHPDALTGATRQIYSDGSIKLVAKLPSELLAALTKESLHNQEEKITIINNYLENRYYYPHITGFGIFIPFDGPSKLETIWYNALQIRQIKRSLEPQTQLEATELVFMDGLRVSIPRNITAIRGKINDSLTRSYYYYYIFDQVLLAENQKPTQTLQKIKERLSELDFDLISYPDEEQYRASLTAFLKPNLSLAYDFT